MRIFIRQESLPPTVSDIVTSNKLHLMNRNIIIILGPKQFIHPFLLLLIFVYCIIMVLINYPCGSNNHYAKRCCINLLDVQTSMAIEEQCLSQPSKSHVLFVVHTQSWSPSLPSPSLNLSPSISSITLVLAISD